MNFRISILAVLCFAINGEATLSCAEPALNGITWRAFSDNPSHRGSTRFRSWNIKNFSHALAYAHPLSYLYQTGAGCGGVAIGDVDGDAQPDLFLVNGPRANQLLRQKDRLNFVDVTRESGTDDPANGWGVGATMFDFDNDGDLDIYVCNYDAPNLLFQNDGRGRFVEVAKRFGLDIRDASYSAAPCDFDRDGDLDLYLLTNRIYYDENRHPKAKRYWHMVDGEPNLLPEFQTYFELDRTNPLKPFTFELGRADYLLRNDGTRFVDVTQRAGMLGRGDGLSATWWDYNQDGWPDLYVGNDFSEPDRLYRNNHDGTFTNAASETLPHTPWFSMGADVGDLNDDGKLDFLIADMSATNHFKQKVNMGDMGAGRHYVESKTPLQLMRNSLFLNTGTARFQEAAYLAGLASSDWTWTVKIVDLDNDGRNDVFFTNGMARNFTDADVQAPAHLIGAARWQYFQDKAPRKEANLVKRMKRPLEFEDVGGEWGLDQIGMSYAAAHGDLDRDGDLDLVVANLDEGVTVFENPTTNQNSILISLKPRNGNYSAIGARIQLTSGEKKQVRQLQPVSGYLACNDPIVHFGLGQQTTVSEIVIAWPSGRTQRIANLQANRIYDIREPSTAIAPKPKRSTESIFVQHDFAQPIEHHEDEFDDFRRQSLLPNKLSQLGPSLAWGDVDADGDEDLFVGQGSGWMSMLYLRDSTGRFVPAPQEAFANDDVCEDMGAVFFDVDFDGDLDLYVASGGYEHSVDHPALRDRLYLNDGQGNFTSSPHRHPQLQSSNGPVAAGDFDGDGDLDLFVGGRMVPGSYPSIPKSSLLRNDRGSLTDVTSEWAPELERSGMVTSAIWTHIDEDTSVDLVTTNEWGPVNFWRNNSGQLEKSTLASPIRTGWWNGIASGDLDHDGDIDFVTTNWGWNTKYHATLSHPAAVYYGDFDGTGRSRLVEAEFEKDTLFPVRGRSCSSRAMPFVSQKFKTFRDFATASLSEIYTKECLSRAQRLEANTLASGIWLNQGAQPNGQVEFKFSALPNMAQISPAFGIVANDLDGDGHLDLCMAQNFFHPQWETGRMDSGLGVILKGKGDGTFHYVPPKSSGIVVPDDARSLSVLDVNRDGRPDLAFGINDGPVRFFVNQTQNQFLTVELTGPLGNRDGIGAQIRTHSRNGIETVYEVSAGGGYLTKGSRQTVIGNAATDPIDKIQVIWPDGEQTIARPIERNRIQLHHPNSPSFVANSQPSESVRDAKGFLTGRIERGNLQLGNGDRPAAFRSFRQALAVDPNNLRALINVGRLSLQNHDIVTAKSCFQKCISLAPQSAEAHQGMGRIDYVQGFFRAAEEKFRKAFQCDRSNPAYLLNLANAQVAQSKSEAAIPAFQQLVKHYPSMAHAWFGLGVALHARQETAKGVRLVEKAIRLRPSLLDQQEVARQYSDILLRYGQMQAAQGGYEQSLISFQKSAKANQSSPNPYSEMGHVWLANGSKRRAIQSYLKACSLNSRDWSVWNNVAWLLATQESVSEKEALQAEAAARRGMELRPNNAEAFDTLGVALATNGKFVEAEKAVQGALAIRRKSDAHVDLTKLQNRLRLYRQRKRYVDP